jgi:ubiquinone/menaquinone biosynthesis C-methylase UbiE
MGLYADHLLPHLIDKMCGRGDMVDWRRRAVAGLRGTVLEVGFGSGLNVPVYPPEVERVLAVEPAGVARNLAAKRIAATTVPIEFIGLDGQSLPLADESVDSALSTFTMCTIPDERRALREIFRVLRPGGALHLVEHGLSPDAAVARRQRRIEPLNRRLAGGCHVTRDHWASIREVGFEIESADASYAKGPRTHSYFYVGVVRRPVHAVTEATGSAEVS